MKYDLSVHGSSGTITFHGCEPEPFSFSRAGQVYVCRNGYSLWFTDDQVIVRAPNKTATPEDEQLKTYCHATRDGDCFWEHCPQNIAGNWKPCCPMPDLSDEDY